MKFAIFIVFSLLAAAFASPVGSGSKVGGAVTGVAASAGGTILGNNKKFKIYTISENSLKDSILC